MEILIKNNGKWQEVDIREIVKLINEETRRQRIIDYGEIEIDDGLDDIPKSSMDMAKAENKNSC